MIGGFFTKPLQILGYKQHVDTLAIDLPMSIEERVGSADRQTKYATVDPAGNHDSTRAKVKSERTGVTWADGVKRPFGQQERSGIEVAE
jgi:hypothetical protein